MYTLILIISMYSESSRQPVSVSVDSVEGFNSLEYCNTAGRAIPKPSHARRDDSAVKFLCVKVE